VISNREVERLYDRYNPRNIRTGDRVVVSVGYKYKARVVGLELDVKNQKVYANLKLMENQSRYPIRVDVADCTVDPSVLYIGHHNNETWK